MDQKLDDLVNGIDREARKFASFAEFQQAQEKGETEWQKPAVAAEENSSSSPSEKVAETVVSSEPSSVEPVSEPSAEEIQKQRTREALDKAWERDQKLPRPQAADVVVTDVEAPPYKVLEAQIVTTRMQLHTVKLGDVTQKDPDVLQYVNETTQVRENDPEWWRDVYMGGQAYANALGGCEAIVDGINVYQERIEKLQRAIQGMRGVLDEKLHGETSETRKRLNAKASGFRVARNKESAARMKVERVEKPKAGNGIKMADATAAAMPHLRGEKLLKFLEKNGITPDSATIEHVGKKWSVR